MAEKKRKVTPKKPAARTAKAGSSGKTAASRTTKRRTMRLKHKA